ncbi:similar to Saccharomyces cerevisiae YJR022W LSM8 Lsm (Like Sm) protein [Maudiozyma saulgeensis]|uniref:LSM2-LSM8 complex subunit LSM8 n=1 Tax=Maudiozyma saulgeensis TaxID=1789683 RepID=A0A1X7R697_9SACH|nr:similar to Saccharomyces cerevisiae YJR022W LSM8 Lsm (Like Sm) protein [Kazachstania saulgeensis]
MSPLLKEYLNKKVVLVTTSGECFIATLEGFDKSTNLVVSNLTNRFIDDDNTESNILSHVQLMRGSEIVACGLYEPTDQETAGESRYIVKAPTIHDTKNRVKDEHLVWMKVAEEKVHSTTKRRKLTK